MMNDDRGVTEAARLKSDEQATGGATYITHTHTHTYTQTANDRWFCPLPCLLCALLAQ